MPILILSPRHIPDSESLLEAATAAGWSVRRLPNWRIEAIPDEKNIAAYGEPLFVAAIAQQLSLALLEPPFAWLSQLPRKYLKREVRLSELGLMTKERFPAFIKPADDKCFPAKVYVTRDDFPSVDYLASNTPILISEPVVWEVEFRCFIRDRRCVTISVYERNGELAQASDSSWPVKENELGEALAFISSFLNDPRVSLPPSVAVDIGRMTDKDWAVIEANPSWGAGIYGCEPREVLYTVARGCRTPETLTVEDKQWIIERTETA
jgi:hypothetical protein